MDTLYTYFGMIYTNKIHYYVTLPLYRLFLNRLPFFCHSLLLLLLVSVVPAAATKEVTQLSPPSANMLRLFVSSEHRWSSAPTG